MIWTLIAQATNTAAGGIRNPSIPGGFGGTAGDGTGALEKYIVLLWQTLITVGGLAALLFLLWGALDWILAGGEEGKITEARKKMTGAVIGLAILASSVAIVQLVGDLIGLDLLQIQFNTAESMTQ
jgi:hypothetical protein